MARIGLGTRHGYLLVVHSGRWYYVRSVVLVVVLLLLLLICIRLTGLVSLKKRYIYIYSQLACQERGEKTAFYVTDTLI